MTSVSVSHKPSVPASRAARLCSRFGVTARRRLHPLAIVVIGVAAITAAARPAAAAEPLFTGEVCTAKKFWDQSHLCGIAPADGLLRFTNVGVHKIAMFTLHAGIDTSLWDGTISGTFGAIASFPNLLFIENIAVNESRSIQVYAGDRVYVGRSDGTLSYRTISVRFDEVPAPPLLGAPPPGGAPPLPEQKIEALLDGLTCPQQGQPGSLDALGITMTVSGTTRFDAETCSDLAALLGSGMRFLVDVTIREDATGALTATDVELADAARPGRRRGQQNRQH